MADDKSLEQGILESAEIINNSEISKGDKESQRIKDSIEGSVDKPVQQSANHSDPEIEGLDEASIEELDKEIKIEDKFGDQSLKAGALGLARGLTLGLSDQAIVKSKLLTPDELKFLKEKNPGSSITGELAGFVAPLVTTGGAAGVAGAAVKGVGKAGLATEAMVAKALSKAAATKAEKKLAKKIIEKSLPKAAGSAVEGAAFGAGQVLSEDALGNTEANAENLIAGAGLGAVTGGALGGAFGAIGATVPTVSKEVSNRVKNAVKDATDVESASLNLMNIKGVKATSLKKHHPEVVSSLPAFLKQKADLKKFQSNKTLFDNITNVKQKAADDIGAIVNKVDDALKGVEDVLPSRAQVAERVIKKLDDEIISKLEGVPGAASQLNPVRKLVSDYTKFGAKKGPISAKDLFNLRKSTDELINYTKEPGKRSVAQDALVNVRQSLTSEFKNLAAKVPADADQATRTLLDDLLVANKDFEIGATVLPFLEKKIEKDLNSSVFGLFDVIGAAGGAEIFALAQIRRFLQSDFKNRIVILRQIENDANKVTNLVDQATNKFLKIGKVGTAIQKLAVPSAVKAMQSISLDSDRKTAPKGETRSKAFKRISSEIQKKVSNPEESLAKLNFKTTRLRTAAPKTAAAIEGVATRGILFLDSKLPKPNPIKTSIQAQLDMDEFEPSDAEMAKFERYLKVVADPMSAIKDLSNGDLTREGVEALQVVYPRLYQEIRRNVMEAVSEKETKLDYNQRIQMGVLLDLPTDESLAPNNVLALQGTFGQPQQPEGPGSSGKQPGASQGAVKPTVGGIKDATFGSRAKTGLTRVVTRE